MSAGLRALAALLTLFTLLLGPTALRPARAQAAVPVLSDRVIDQAGWLQPAQHQALVERLARLEREQGTQLVVLLLPSTAPEDIAAYAQRVADQWKLGRREVGDGLLLVVATQDRRVRLEVAKALEGAIPDLAARRVIDEAIVPAFRRGEPAAGLLAAVDRVQALLQGEGLPPPDPGAPTGRDAVGEDEGFGLAAIALVALPMVALVLTRIAGRKLGPLASAALVGFVTWDMGAGLLAVAGMALLALLVALVLGALSGRPSVDRALRQVMRPSPWTGGSGGWNSGGWGGGGGGGHDGGGFSAGGGGDFGGGGASGDW